MKIRDYETWYRVFGHDIDGATLVEETKNKEDALDTAAVLRVSRRFDLVSVKEVRKRINVNHS